MLFMNKRILVVDDEETLCEAVRFNLEAEGYAVDVAYSAEEALSLNLEQYDLLLLDIMMGEISGLQLASTLRAKPETAQTPIIFCTAKNAEEDMVHGLDLGADDYIVKPYSIRNLLARVRSVLRRQTPKKSETAGKEKTIEYLSLCVIPSKKRCTIDGREVPLPRKEFEILLKFISHRGRIFSREEILREIWPDDVVVLDRVVDVNITRLRRKLGRYGKHIVTRSGYGYGFIE